MYGEGHARPIYGGGPARSGYGGGTACPLSFLQYTLFLVRTVNSPLI